MSLSSPEISPCLGQGDSPFLSSLPLHLMLCLARGCFPGRALLSHLFVRPLLHPGEAPWRADFGFVWNISDLYRISHSKIHFILGYFQVKIKWQRNLIIQKIFNMACSAYSSSNTPFILLFKLQRICIYYTCTALAAGDHRQGLSGFGGRERHLEIMLAVR